MPVTMPLSRLPRSACEEARKVARRPASAPVLIESSHGEQVWTDLRDISVFGGSVSGEAAWFRPGSFITVHLAGNRRVPAIIRWMRGGACGMEFLRPIAALEAELHTQGCGPA